MRKVELYNAEFINTHRLSLQPGEKIAGYKTVGWPDGSLLLGSAEKTAKLESHGIVICHALRLGVFDTDNNPALFLSHDVPTDTPKTTKRFKNGLSIMLNKGYKILDTAELLMPDLSEIPKYRKQYIDGIKMVEKIGNMLMDNFDQDLAVSRYSVRDKRIPTNGGISFGIQYSPTNSSIIPTSYEL